MSIIEEIVARFVEKASDTFQEIGQIGALADLDDKPPLTTPALYIYVRSEASDPNERVTGPSSQLTHLDVGFLIIASNISDMRSGAAAGDIEALKDCLRDVAVGWQPPSAEGPIENIGGEIIKASKGEVRWDHTMGVPFYVRGKTS